MRSVMAKVMAVTEFGKPLELVERALPEVTADEVGTCAVQSTIHHQVPSARQLDAHSLMCAQHLVSTTSRF
jgi:hypothetical protein